MDWQLLLTCVAIAVASAYIGWRGRRTLWPKKGDCGGGCGCAKSVRANEPKLIAREQLTLRHKS
jgi:hypothetical protein